MELLRDFVIITNWAFLFYITVYTVLLFGAAVFGAAANDRRTELARYKAELSLQELYNYFPVSVLVPAYNEAVTILDSVLSLTKLDYPEYEIIIIDDGSRDETSQVLIDALKLKKTQRPIRRQVPGAGVVALYESENTAPPITLIVKENGGKADALNAGINASQYPYFLTVDADSVLQKDTLKKIVMPVIEDSRVVAVGGIVQVANNVVIENGEIKEQHFPYRPMVLMQVLDYARIFLGTRMLLDSFNGNMIISGTCGLFRKDIVVQAGGYNTEIVGEDMELVVKLHAFCRSRRISYRIAYAPDAICWTQVPTSFRGLRIQRRRWQLGLFQSIYLHRDVLFNPSYGTMGMVSMIYYLLLEAVEPLVEIIGLAVIVLAAVLHMLNLPFMLAYFGLFFILSALVTVTSFFVRNYSARTPLTVIQAIYAIIFSFVECLGFHQLLSIFRISALVHYRRDGKEWGAIDRAKHQKGKREGQDEKASVG